MKPKKPTKRVKEKRATTGKSPPSSALPLQPHQWTNTDGEVLMLRRIPKNRTSKNNFIYPSGAGSKVESPDWNPEPVCGGGLHGWPWGFGLGEGSDYDILEDVWLVIGAKPEDVCGELGNGWKCKIRKGVIRFEGNFSDAFAKVLPGFEGCMKQLASGNASRLAASGNDSRLAASGYDSRLAASGNDSRLAASGNDSSLAASGNDSSLAASGNDSRLAASGNASRLAASGENSVVAIAANRGRAKVGENGAFALAYWSESSGWNFVVGKEGVDGVKAGTWYEVVDGKLSEIKD